MLLPRDLEERKREGRLEYTYFVGLLLVLKPQHHVKVATHR